MKFAKTRNPFSKKRIRQRAIHKLIREINSYRPTSEDMLDCVVEYSKVAKSAWLKLNF